MRFLRLIRKQDGIALVMALGMLVVLTVLGSTALYYTAANERNARGSGANESAYSLSEAGIAEGISKLANASDPTLTSLLGSQASPNVVDLGSGRSATYWGVLGGTTWTITSIGKLTNPTGAGTAQVSRTSSRTVEIVGLDVGSFAGDWDRLHQEASTPCLDVPINIPARLTTFSSLCLLSGGSITGAATRLQVAGNVTLAPGSGSSTVKSAGAGAGWTISGNVLTSNNAFATATLTGLATSASLDSSSHGFAIPINATITGITARVEKKTSVASTFQDLNVQLLKSGSPVGTDKALTGTNWGTSDAYTTYGTSTDLWGTTWTPAEVNASNFGLRLVARNAGTTSSSSVRNAGTGTGAAWTTPGNVLTSNNAYATQSLTAGTTSGTLDATNFGFALPSDAVVTGVSARIERKGSVNSTLQDLNVFLLKAGAQTGNNKAATGVFWTNADAYRTYGAAGDMWGATLTPAEVNASTFGLRLQARNFHGSTTSIASIDHMEVTLFYNAYNTATGSIDHMEITVYWSPITTYIGTSGTPIASADIVGTCKLVSNPAHTPCTSADNVFSNPVPTTLNTVPHIPAVDFTYWFKNAKPGPKYPCTHTTGTPPSFDSNGATTSAPDGSNGSEEMAPEDADYTCQYRNAAGTVLGELSWNRTTRVLDVKGTIFFDGDALFHIHGDYVIHYHGRATIWIYGKWHNDEIICAGGTGTTSCRGNADASLPANSTMESWDPETNLLVLVTNGEGNANAWDFHINAAFQGILWGRGNCDIKENAAISGPLLCDTLDFPSGDTQTVWNWPALPAAAAGQIYTTGTKLDKQLILGQQSG